MSPIYNTEDKYLYEILEDYQDAKSEEEQEEIFHAFCSLLWSNPNKRSVCKKTIRFKVRNDLLPTELGRIFDTWSEVEYTSYRSMTKDTGYASLIRQKINNIYSNLFDERICLQKEYLHLLKLPKSFYFQWIHGRELDPDTVTAAIDDAMHEAEKLKQKYAGRKMKLSWNAYKKLTETYLRGIFNRFICMDDYEDKTHIHTDTGIWLEDNYCIRYFCRSLDGCFKKYQKEYYGLPKSSRHPYARCKSCNTLFEKKHNRQTYCPACSVKRAKERHIRYNNKRKRQLEKPNSLCI